MNFTYSKIIFTFVKVIGVVAEAEEIEIRGEAKREIDYMELLRKDRLPHILCEGCGIGTIINSLAKALAEMSIAGEIDLDKVVLVSGIGCSSRVPGYFNLDSLHTTHGRPLAFATGIKLANPELKVIVITGDGDNISIGGNHFLHACRRNMDIVTICANNYNYGMTGGQHSPTTPKGAKTTTTPRGNVEPAIDACKVAAASGANYVVRLTVLVPDEIKKAIKKALRKEGFSYIEVVTQCPTAYGRRNKMRTAIKMLEYFRENTITISKAKELEEAGEDISGKIIVGEYVDRDRPGFLRLLGLIKEEKVKEKKEVIEVEEIEVDKEKVEKVIKKLMKPKARYLIEEGKAEDLEKIIKEEDKK